MNFHVCRDLRQCPRLDLPGDGEGGGGGRGSSRAVRAVQPSPPRHGHPAGQLHTHRFTVIIGGSSSLIIINNTMHSCHISKRGKT